MFLDFALLIGEQGDVLDNIEYNAKEESKCIDIDFTQAFEWRRKIRRQPIFQGNNMLIDNNCDYRDRGCYTTTTGKMKIERS
jgi:hypothetical protein